VHALAMGVVGVIDRRNLLLGTAATGALASFPALGAQAAGLRVSVTQFGAREGGGDNTHAIQAAVDAVQRAGGGTVLVPRRFRCGNIVVSGNGVTIQGQNGWLIDGRLTIAAAARSIEVRDLTMLHTRGEDSSYHLDVSGRNCRFTRVSLVKDPIAGGYQMYLRQNSAGCRFTRLRLKGSNGIMVAGNDHSFDGFELESAMTEGFGGDDAFAIKALGEPTANITIRNGVVRGFYAIASFGSEVGTSGEASDYRGAVRNVAVTDVTADRCSALAFFKPGALIYDWRNGLIDGVRLERLKLTDERGERFGTGVRMIAGRGAIIRNVIGRNLEIRARAMSQGKFPTAAIDLSILEGADATFEDIDLQMTFADPFNGAEHGPATPGFPIDHIVRIEKSDPRRGEMRRISLDVSGRGSRFGGVYIGQGLDNAVTLRRAQLERVGLHPPASLGGGGIWSDSRVTLGDVSIDSPVLPKFGGRAMGRNE
jgi:hypothetical protein